VGPRLFVDFNADACVVIRDRLKFTQMLSQACSRHLPDATMHEGPALYVDPLFPPKGPVFVPAAKHFKYAYQDEHRFCWLPTAAIGKAKYLDVQIGSLKEFSDLIAL
jgi:hypothetical protein